MHSLTRSIWPNQPIGSCIVGIEPDEPDEPDKPNKPDEPDKPNKPDEPDEPDKPDEPDEPDKLFAKPDDWSGFATLMPAGLVVLVILVVFVMYCMNAIRSGRLHASSNSL